MKSRKLPRMRARIVIFLFIAAAALVAWWFLGNKERLPNILLITLDTTRKDHLSCYGYGRKTTPNLDRLAADGQRFEKAVAVSSWTLPTHASLFTGLFPFTHGAHYVEQGKLSLQSAVDVGDKELYGWFKANGLPEQARTLAETLKTAGYATGGVGAGPWLKPLFGLDQGFDFFDCDVVSIAGRRADEVFALAMRFLRRVDDRPFFLFLNFFDPHDPYDPPPEHAFRFFPREKLAQARKDPAVAAEFEVSRYDGEIFFMDLQIGRLFRWLKERDLYDDTWIIVIGDHGEQFGEHGLTLHGVSLFEGEVGCPLIIKWPKGFEDLPPPGALCQQTDIMPTILARLGIEPEAPMEGRALSAPPGPAICELFRNEGSIKTGGPRFARDLAALYSGNYKLILSTKENDPDAGLFDLAVDAGETRDLSHSEGERAAALQALMESYRRDRPAPLPSRRIESIDAKTDEQLKALGYGN